MGRLVGGSASSPSLDLSSQLRTTVPRQNYTHRCTSIDTHIPFHHISFQSVNPFSIKKGKEKQLNPSQLISWSTNSAWILEWVLLCFYPKYENQLVARGRKYILVSHTLMRCAWEEERGERKDGRMWNTSNSQTTKRVFDEAPGRSMCG